MSTVLPRRCLNKQLAKLAASADPARRIQDSYTCGMNQRRNSGRGSNVVPLLPVPTLRGATRRPKFAAIRIITLYYPRSAGQEGFEHSPITSTDVVGNTTLSRERFPWLRPVFHWHFPTEEGPGVRISESRCTEASGVLAPASGCHPPARFPSSLVERARLAKGRDGSQPWRQGTLRQSMDSTECPAAQTLDSPPPVSRERRKHGWLRVREFTQRAERR
jgi:hypothetical protein